MISFRMPVLLSLPMDKKLNGSGGEWYKLETTWRNALDNGNSVRVNIKPQYSGQNKRPNSFEISYIVNDKEVILTTLKNTPTGE